MQLDVHVDWMLFCFLKMHACLEMLAFSFIRCSSRCTFAPLSFAVFCSLLRNWTIMADFNVFVGSGERITGHDVPAVQLSPCCRGRWPPADPGSRGQIMWALLLPLQPWHMTRAWFPGHWQSGYSFCNIVPGQPYGIPTRTSCYPFLTFCLFRCFISSIKFIITFCCLEFKQANQLYRSRFLKCVFLICCFNPGVGKVSYP